MDVVVQPGVNWVDLNKRIQSSGLFLPMDPSPTATIGGMVSTNCSGTNAFRYGTMKDWVINVTVVLPNGRIIKTRQRPRKSSAGYNLTSLFVGAEGTLGMITEITFPISKLAELIDISKQESDKLGVFASIVGHVGDGNFHQAVMYDAKNQEHVQAVEDCVHKMMDPAVELGGTVSQ
ncbi:D-lactate dehydrogenase [Colletotrichum sp. SAR11_239]|nr:D-lactate dehydrogenase [Colletotrichum sp. SAR11_239]